MVDDKLRNLMPYCLVSYLIKKCFGLCEICKKIILCFSFLKAVVKSVSFNSSTICVGILQRFVFFLFNNWLTNFYVCLEKLTKLESIRVI